MAPYGLTFTKQRGSPVTAAFPTKRRRWPLFPKARLYLKREVLEADIGRTVGDSATVVYTPMPFDLAAYQAAPGPATTDVFFAARLNSEHRRRAARVLERVVFPRLDSFLFRCRAEAEKDVVVQLLRAVNYPGHIFQVNRPATSPPAASPGR